MRSKRCAVQNQGITLTFKVERGEIYLFFAAENVQRKKKILYRKKVRL